MGTSIWDFAVWTCQEDTFSYGEAQMDYVMRKQMRRVMGKEPLWHMRTAKVQASLRISTV